MTSSDKLKLRNSISIDEAPFFYKQNSQLLKSIWNRMCSLRYISLSLFLLRPTTEIYEIPTQEEILYPRNTHEKKLWTHEIPTRKIWDEGNTHEKKFGTHEIREKIWDPHNTNKGTMVQWH